MSIADDVVREWESENADAQNMMTLYQSVADHFFPNQNTITVSRTDGEDKSLPILDPTGMLDFQKMSAGMVAVILPQGQNFFRLDSSDYEQNNNDRIRGILNQYTMMVNQAMLQSNFPTELSQYLKALTGFGTGNLYSGFDVDDMKLYYKNWFPQCYRFCEDKYGTPNRCIIRWQYTARQAYGLWGDDAGEKIADIMKSDESKANQKFWFLFRVAKNKDRNPQYSDNKNYKFKEVIVNESEKSKVTENGYETFPYHISRWLLASQEKWGRGQGTIALSADKELQVQYKALNLNADLANNPPRETLSSFEGTPKVYPGANNIVMEANSIRALDRTLQGNFPITKDLLEMHREIVHECFFIRVFAPLDNLPGDRRTTVEIIERVKAGYIQLIEPVTRIYTEGLSPCIVRTFHMLLKNGLLPPPPPELRSLKIEYLGRLALALQEQQADALQRFSQFAINMESVMPNFLTDNINVDRAGRRMATTFGVNEGDFNTEDERDAIRQQRAQAQQAQMEMEAMQSMGKAYKDGSTAPEQGSPAGMLMEQ